MKLNDIRIQWHQVMLEWLGLEARGQQGRECSVRGKGRGWRLLEHLQLYRGQRSGSGLTSIARSQRATLSVAGRVILQTKCQQTQRMPGWVSSSRYPVTSFWGLHSDHAWCSMESVFCGGEGALQWVRLAVSQPITFTFLRNYGNKHLDMVSLPQREVSSVQACSGSQTSQVPVFICPRAANPQLSPSARSRGSGPGQGDRGCVLFCRRPGERDRGHLNHPINNKCSELTEDGRHLCLPCSTFPFYYAFAMAHSSHVKIKQAAVGRKTPRSSEEEDKRR